MEWVYSTPQEEPTLLESAASAGPAGPPTTAATFDIFAYTAAVEEPSSEPEPEYFGDDGSPPQTPEAAFAAFAAARRADFSAADHREAAGRRPGAKRVLAAESRAERVCRLQAEVRALGEEVGGVGAEGAEKAEVESEADATLSNFETLREQLRAIEASMEEGKGRGQGRLFMRRGKAKQRMAKLARGEEEEEEEGSVEGLTLQMTSLDVGALAAVERRVAALEKSVGVAHFEETCNGEALGPMAADVRNRVELLRDPGLPEKLKRDARDIADILQKEMQEERGGEALRTAAVLQKMEKWENVADTVPLVVERLRSFKRLQDEAGQFVAALASLGGEVDRLARRADDNEVLVSNVQRSLKSNVETVQRNLDLLERKLDAATERLS